MTARARDVDRVREDVEHRDVERDAGGHLAVRQRDDLLEHAGLLERAHGASRGGRPRSLRIVAEVVAAHQPAQVLVRHRPLLGRDGEHRRPP